MSKKKAFWKFVNEAENETAELILYGDISNDTWYEDDITPGKFAQDLRQCGTKDLTVRINSPGGDVFAAQAIHSLLAAYPGTVTAHIDGICASAATVIACAANQVIMPGNALFMIHNPATMLFGAYDADSMQKMAGVLQTVKQSIVSVYAKKCGNLSEDDINKLMDEETWMTADEAKGYGFADTIDDAYTVTNALKDGMVIVNNVAFECPGNVKGLERILNKKGKKNMDNKELLQKIMNLLGVHDGNEGVEDKEKERLTDLGELKTGNPYVDSIVDTAMKTGKSADEVKPFIDSIISVKPTEQKDNVLEAITNLIKDNLQSGSMGVKPSPKLGAKETQDAARVQEINDVITMANKLRGEK